MLCQEIKKIIEKSIKELQKEKKLPKFKIPKVLVEKPREKSHGDYSTNIALQIGKIIGENPIKIAELTKSRIKNYELRIFDKVEPVNPGFINFFISKEYLQKQVREILKEKEKFGSLKIGRGQKINVEFISANPTGPLTLGNGRGGFCGDTLINVLEKAGYKVEREYYVNDVGEQIRKLGRWEYKGKYIDELKNKIRNEDIEKRGEKAAQIILNDMIKPTIKKMGIRIDIWFSEKSLHRKKEADKIIAFLKKKKLAYEKDNALWFKSTKFGDDKDRVLIKKDGEKTYLASDIAYLKNKFNRGFKKLIFFWGADHYGYINRIKAGAEALGYKKEQIDIIIMQLVRLIKKGKEVKMSKRRGAYITLDELIDEVGLDAARFFFLMRSVDTHLSFDLDLAKEQSRKNPVYYVQYAHARINSILAKLKTQNSPKESLWLPAGQAKLPEGVPLSAEPYGTGKTTTQNLKLLKNSSEINLMKQLVSFPEIVEDTANDYQVQRIPQYALDLADVFHQFYESCRVINKDEKLTQARLSLISATQIALKNTLNLMGISAPEKM